MKFPTIEASQNKHVLTLCSPVWVWGCLPSWTFVGLSRLMLPQFTCIIEGSIGFIMVELRSFLHAVDFKRTNAPTEGDLHEYFMELSVEAWSALIKQGCKAVYEHGVKNTVLVLPPGWILIEHVFAGPMIYGIRQSVFRKMPACAGAVLDYYKASGKSDKFLERANEIFQEIGS